MVKFRRISVKIWNAVLVGLNGPRLPAIAFFVLGNSTPPGLLELSIHNSIAPCKTSIRDSDTNPTSWRSLNIARRTLLRLYHPTPNPSPAK